MKEPSIRAIHGTHFKAYRKKLESLPLLFPSFLGYKQRGIENYVQFTRLAGNKHTPPISSNQNSENRTLIWNRHAMFEIEQRKISHEDIPMISTVYQSVNKGGILHDGGSQQTSSLKLTTANVKPVRRIRVNSLIGF
eukprot:TRINITY_DN3061_c0_g1_i2.p1 TRINITY_DN3061_c0_g1~~TRINITY_DN3061_c0_g1_i2.p1  ORF type:complete len:137 (+),score=5.57 TRINITY_DN3061_c0_g1_i2:108-518(+)